MKYPLLIGLLVSGIVFNGLLCSFGLLGLEFWEALYLTAGVLLILLWLVVRWLIQPHDREEN